MSALEPSGQNSIVSFEELWAHLLSEHPDILELQDLHLHELSDEHDKHTEDEYQTPEDMTADEFYSDLRRDQEEWA